MSSFHAMNRRENSPSSVQNFITIYSLSWATSIFCLSALTWVCNSGRHIFLFTISGLQIKQSGCQGSSSSWKNLMVIQHLLLLNFKIRNTNLVLQCLGLEDDIVTRMRLGQKAHFGGKLAKRTLALFWSLFCLCSRKLWTRIFLWSPQVLSCLEICS